MKMPSVLTLTFALNFAPSLVFAAATQAPTPMPRATASPAPLSSYNWSTSASPSLATNPPPIDIVRAFFNILDPNAGIEGMVCAAKFANFQNSGTLTMVVGHCTGNDLDFVDNTPTGFQWRTLIGLVDSSDNVSSGVQDILGNGTSEIVVTNYLTRPMVYGQCTTTWPVIYAWDGTNYSNQSSQPQYASWYQQQLTTLQNQEAKSPSNCLQAEIDKIQRVLGNPAAGLTDATTWAASPNSADRLFAAQILGDIGTPAALGVLQTVAADADPYVKDVGQRFIFSPTLEAPQPAAQQTITNTNGL